MTATMTPTTHNWQFTSSEAGSGMEGGGVTVLAGVCSACGLVRSVVLRPREETRIDVSGACPAAAGRPAPSE